jgi:hypothetical protein
MDHTTRTVESLSKELFEDKEQPSSMSEMEQKIRRLMLWLGGILLRVWLKWEEGRYPPKTTPCPHCGGQTDYQRQREGTLHTMFGTLNYGGHITPARHAIKVTTLSMNG